MSKVEVSPGGVGFMRTSAKKTVAADSGRRQAWLSRTNVERSVPVTKTYTTTTRSTTKQRQANSPQLGL